MDESQITQLIALLIALISAFLAWWQKNQKDQIIGFYTNPVSVPATNVIDANVLQQLPQRSYQMSDATKHWLIFDATPANQVAILQQIADAEKQQLTKYRINFIGGYYDIEYGLQYGGSGNSSGKG